MFTDKEIANLLNEVSESLAKSEKKAKKLKKDDMPQFDEQAPEAPAMEEAPAEEAPAMEEAPAEEPAQEEAPAMEEAPSEEIADESEDAPLTDEELHQVYSSMEADELERHFMIIRDVLNSVYGESEGGEQEEAMEGEQAPAMEQAPEMEQAPAMEQAPEEDEALKSEFAMMKKENSELKDSLAKLAKAIEKMSPVRKSVTSTLNKSESSEQGLSKAEIASKISEIVKKPLTKNERQAINNYWLNGVGQESVLEIIKTHGGK